MKVFKLKKDENKKLIWIEDKEFKIELGPYNKKVGKIYLDV